MPRIRPVRALLLASLALSPALATAQEGGKSHTVKTGDTLWDLAQLYLGDPFLWPEIYRLNTALIRDPHWIYPGQVFQLPGDASNVTSTSSGPSRNGKSMTVFHPDRYRVERTSRASLVLRPRGSAVRSGEFLHAPFLWSEEGLKGSGVLDRSTSADGIGSTLTLRPVQQYDRIYVQLPEGAAGVTDERLLIYREGERIPGEGQVIVPTGIVRLVGPASGRRAEAMLMTKFEDVYSGMKLTALDTLVMPGGVFPTRVEFGTRSKVIWMLGNPVIPTTGTQLIIGAGSTDGLVPGDQITLERSMGSDVNGVPLPSEDVAVALVTRVTTWGASALIVAQRDGGLKVGMPARVTAKMP